LGLYGKEDKLDWSDLLVNCLYSTYICISSK